MTREIPDFAVVDDARAAIYGAMSPERKLALLAAMWRAAWGTVWLDECASHPAEDDDAIRRRVARRMSGGALRAGGPGACSPGRRTPD